MNHKKVKSFFIKAVKEEVSYKLHLLTDVKIYLMFYVLLLKSANSSTSYIENLPLSNIERE